jgi:dipeptidyl aminopeptidase/acylaminoacyl peptidase
MIPMPRVFTSFVRSPVFLLPYLALLLPPTLSTAGEHASRADYELAAKWSPDELYKLLYSTELLPQWVDDGDVFWYRFLNSDGRHYWLVDPPRAHRELLFDRFHLAAELQRATGSEVDGKQLDLPEFEFREGTRFLVFEHEGARFEYDRLEARLSFVDSVAAAPPVEPWRAPSPDGRWCVFARANDLYVVEAHRPAVDAVQLTSDGTYALSWGEDWELVSDEATDPRTIGVVWSPNSRYFAVKRADLREVDDLWLMDDLARPRPTLHTIKSASVGGKVPRGELWIGEVDAASTGSARMTRVAVERWADQTLEDLFGGNLWWAADSSELFFTRRHRDYTRLDLCAADPATGAVRVLVEERHEGMVYTRMPIMIPGRKEILWWSMRDGWGHLYRYALDGTLLGQVTEGVWMVDEQVGFGDDGETVFFTGMGREEGRNPYYRHLYRVPLEGGRPRLLTPEDAEHKCRLSPSGKYFLDSYSRVDLPTRAVLRGANGTLILELEQADISGLAEAGWEPPQIFHVPGADSETEQWGVMWKPFKFDPDRRYPIVTRVYPGRQGEYIPREFSPVNVETSLAQLGCIVVRFGNRGGTWERGTTYREYGREEFRDYGLADKKAVLETLAAQHPWIDVERAGIFGGSSGGFMTVSAMLVYPEFFKVGVAMTAPNDPMLYSNEWVERYAGVTQSETEDGSVVWEASAEGNLEIAGNLQGRLLMIYGSMDELVPLPHLYRQADAFIQAGKRFDMFVVPGAGHDLGGWRYLYGLVLDYFGTHLLGEERDSVEGLFPGADPGS